MGAECKALRMPTERTGMSTYLLSLTRGQGYFVHCGAAANIDEHRSLLHARDCLGIDEASGGRGPWQGCNDVIALAHDFAHLRGPHHLRMQPVLSCSCHQGGCMLGQMKASNQQQKAGALSFPLSPPPPPPHTHQQRGTSSSHLCFLASSSLHRIVSCRDTPACCKHA